MSQNFTTYAYFPPFRNIGDTDNGVMVLADVDLLQSQALTESDTTGSKFTHADQSSGDVLPGSSRSPRDLK